MSTETRRQLETGVLIVSLLIAIVGFAKGWFILPVQVEEHTTAIKEISTSYRADHDLLTRIDTRQEQMNRDIAEIKALVRQNH
jgi:hypothetical protein